MTNISCQRTHIRAETKGQVTREKPSVRVNEPVWECSRNSSAAKENIGGGEREREKEEPRRALDGEGKMVLKSA